MAKPKSKRGGRGRPAAPKVSRAALIERRQQAHKVKSTGSALLEKARAAFERNPTPAAQRALDKAAKTRATALDAWRAARDAVNARGKNRATLIRRAAALKGSVKRQERSVKARLANVARSTFAVRREVDGLKFLTRLTWITDSPGAGWQEALSRLAERAAADEPNCERWQAALDAIFIDPADPDSTVRRRLGTTLYTTAERAASELVRFQNEVLAGNLGERYKQVGVPVLVEITGYMPRT